MRRKTFDDQYPIYASGSFYGLSIKSVELLGKLDVQYVTRLTAEDAQVGVWLYPYVVDYVHFTIGFYLHALPTRRVILDGRTIRPQHFAQRF